MITLLSTKSIKEERAAKLDRIEAMRKVADDEQRELDETEMGQIDVLLKEHDDMATQLERAEKYEAAQKQLTEQRTGMTTANTGPLVPGSAPEPAMQSRRPYTPQSFARIAAVPRCSHRLNAFHGPDAQEQAYGCGMWFKAALLRDRQAMQWCKDAQLPIQFYTDDGHTIFMDQQTVDDNTKGGFLVPAPLATAVIAVRERTGITRRSAQFIEMPSTTLGINKRGVGLTVYNPNEGAAITTSETTFSRITLTTIDRATLTTISNKLLRNANISVADYVATEIGQAFSEQMDLEYIQGDAGGPVVDFGETGLKVALDAAGKQTASGNIWSEITLADFHATKGLLPEKYHNDRTKWIMSRAFHSEVVEKLVLAAGGISAADMAAGAAPRFMGYPIDFTEKMPTAEDAANFQVEALFGDFFAASIVGENSMLQIAASEHRFFDTDEIGIRGTYSYDINVHGGGSGAADAYVGLETTNV